MSVLPRKISLAAKTTGLCVTAELRTVVSFSSESLLKKEQEGVSASCNGMPILLLLRSTSEINIFIFIFSVNNCRLFILRILIILVTLLCSMLPTILNGNAGGVVERPRTLF